MKSSSRALSLPPETPIHTQILEDAAICPLPAHSSNPTRASAVSVCRVLFWALGPSMSLEASVQPTGSGRPHGEGIRQHVEWTECQKLWRKMGGNQEVSRWDTEVTLVQSP